MLMVQDDVGAAGAAERVGYESASQFSREFKRFFGVPPASEAQRVRLVLGVSNDVRGARSERAFRVYRAGFQAGWPGSGLQIR